MKLSDFWLKTILTVQLKLSAAQIIHTMQPKVQYNRIIQYLLNRYQIKYWYFDHEYNDFESQPFWHLCICHKRIKFKYQHGIFYAVYSFHTIFAQVYFLELVCSMWIPHTGLPWEGTEVTGDHYQLAWPVQQTWNVCFCSIAMHLRVARDAKCNLHFSIATLEPTSGGHPSHICLS